LSRSAAREPFCVNTSERTPSTFYVYILASLTGTLYAGLTDDLRRRVEEHKLGLVDGFTKRYAVNRLMYFEIFRDAENAERRERQIKKYRREKKIALFAKSNPRWEDLSKTLPVSYTDILM
jgi:putative endonuclease